jgi:polar amino acid transport system permease protein
MGALLSRQAEHVDRLASPEGERVDVAQALAPRKTWTWVLAAVVLVLAAQLVNMLLTNPHFEWGVVARYFTSETVLTGVLMTLFLTAAAMVIGLVLGGALVVCRMSGNPVLRIISSSYIWFFRGTPQLVQLIFWFNIGLLLPVIGLGVPFGPVFVSGRANDLITPMLAAIVGLGLHEAAYQAEIYRAGLLSVDEGQVEAAKALGMSPTRMFFRIQLPQAMRFIVPPTTSAVIALAKGTSLVSVIGGAELLFAVQEIYSQTYQTVPLLIVASLWYLIITTVLNILQFFVEQHYSKGASRSGSSSMIGRLLERRASVRTLSLARGNES